MKSVVSVDARELKLPSMSISETARVVPVSPFSPPGGLELHHTASHGQHGTPWHAGDRAHLPRLLAGCWLLDSLNSWPSPSLKLTDSEPELPADDANHRQQGCVMNMES